MVVNDTVVNNLITLFKRKPRVKELFFLGHIKLTKDDTGWGLAYLSGNKHYGCKCKLKRKAIRNSLSYDYFLLSGKVLISEQCRCKPIGGTHHTKSYMAFTNTGVVSITYISGEKAVDPSTYFIDTNSIVPNELYLSKLAGSKLADLKDSLESNELFKEYKKKYVASPVGNYKTLKRVVVEENNVIATQQLLRNVGF